MSIDPSMHILIVDDQKTMLRIIRGLLDQLGVKNVVEALSGESALQAIDQNDPFDLIISDWNMEGMSGLDFLKNIRTNQATRHTPFIMVTAESKTENVIAAKHAGVSNYIIKPFNADTLRGKIEAVMKSGH